MKLIPPRAQNASRSLKVRWFRLFLLGAAFGAVVGLAGYFVTGHLDWLAAIPIGGVLLAMEPLKVIWSRRK